MNTDNYLKSGEIQGIQAYDIFLDNSKCHSLHKNFINYSLYQDNILDSCIYMHVWIFMVDFLGCLHTFYLLILFEEC